MTVSCTVIVIKKPALLSFIRLVSFYFYDLIYKDHHELFLIDVAIVLHVLANFLFFVSYQPKIQWQSDKKELKIRSPSEKQLAKTTLTHFALKSPHAIDLPNVDKRERVDSANASKSPKRMGQK